MITIFFRDGQRLECPTAVAARSEAFDLAITCYDAGGRSLGRFLRREISGYSLESSDMAAGSARALEWSSLDPTEGARFDLG